MRIIIRISLFIWCSIIVVTQSCYQDQKSTGRSGPEDESDAASIDIDKEGGTDVSLHDASLGNTTDAEHSNSTIDTTNEDGDIEQRIAWKPPLKEEYAPMWRTETGFKNSTPPFCATRDRGPISQSVWSDERGVFVFTNRPGPLLASTFAGETEELLLPELHFNDGSGWQSVFKIREAYSASSKLTGFINGQLVLSTAISRNDCGIRLISQEGVDYCTSGAPSTAISVFTVNETIAYAIGRDEYVYKYDNDDPSLGWKPYGETLGERGEILSDSLWADERTVVVSDAGSRVFIYRDDNPKPELLPGPFAGENPKLWGFSNTDIWRYSIEQLARYDGSEWEIVWTADDADLVNECWGQIGIWGSDGILYFHNRHQLFRWDGSQVELLASWPCVGNTVSIHNIWGNSPSEVFLSVSDVELEASPCGDKLILWYDGDSLRQI